MKSFTLLPLAALASALVIPDEETSAALRMQLQDPQSDSIWDHIPDVHDLWNEAEESVLDFAGSAKHKVEDAFDAAYETIVKYDEKFQSAFAGEAWLANVDESDDSWERPPPHHGPPHGPPHDRKPKHPHHGPPNETVYELIAKSKYTTKLAKLINDYPDLVELLNGTKANYTVFAPTDAAFEKIPKHAPKPSKEDLKKILTYHVSPEFYPAGRVLTTRTIPTALDAQYIEGVPQRLSTQIGFRGLTVNFYARIIAINIFGTNGVIHGIDSILLPPPKAVDVITALPGEFSTLELALYKTGLFDSFADPKLHNGGTLFAPSNSAFQRLGPRLSAFLFSKYGLKYLKAIILYHAAPEITLYSDAIYKSDDKETSNSPGHRIPKGVYHIELPTGLEDKHLSVDIARYGRLIEIKINGFSRVAVSDGIVADGVIHVVPNVLVPPKEPTATPIVVDESMSIEELTDLLEPYVEADSESFYDWEL